MRPGSRARNVLAVALVATVQAACLHEHLRVEAHPLRTDTAYEVNTPVRAHMSDGSVILFRNGATVTQDSIHGSGMRFGILRQDSTRVGVVAADAIVGLETYTEQTLTASTLAHSALVTAGGVVLTVAGLVAIACAADPKCFGSCPTVYTMGENGEVLEAELFSYSIAPLLEARDVDLLGTAAAPDGTVELEIRNEALETHMLNHLQLLEVTHAPHERVLPDAGGAPLVLSDLHAPVTARDRAGRRMEAALAHADGTVFSSTEERLVNATTSDFRDHVDLTFPAPEADSAALVLRLRNSLLNTVLFYDVMLGSAGARALDWLGSDLQRIGPAVELGAWYVSRMGMWIHVEQDGVWREVARVPDSGPIAWKDVAVMVPVVRGEDELRVRLSFVTDEWRIDRVALAHRARHAEPRVLPVASITELDGSTRDDVVRDIAEPDENYLVTHAGQAYTARFDTGPAPAGATRTFLLSSQGYYTEWIRPVWLREATRTDAFRAEDGSIVEAIRRWQAVKPEFERRFHETRIPVRTQ